MKIYSEISLDSFEWWSGAKYTAARIDGANAESGYNLWEELETILESIEPDEGWDETAINDLLWFDGDTVLTWLGLAEAEEDLEE